MGIRTSVEGRRGCGYRKPGGLYLMGGKLGAPCGKLPLECKRCPTCDHGLKPTRGWTWIDPREWFKDGNCQGLLPLPDGMAERLTAEPCVGCPLYHPPERAGLIWIGEQHYATPRHFAGEAARVGVSRRLPTLSIPKGLKIGETLVLLAHQKGIKVECPDCKGLGQITVDFVPLKCENCGTTGHVHASAIFAAFTPTALEYVVKGDESDEELKALEDRGIDLVKVEREQTTLEGVLEEVRETRTEEMK